MCEFAGSHDLTSVVDMVGIMSYRGPDDEGIVPIKTKGSQFWGGMRRLSIIDLNSSGLCPYQVDGYTLLYNGEVYNYRELRDQLRQEGHVFKTASDTEVVLKSYIHWGPEAFKRFNGMFALAIANNEEVVLARDIAGEKPLYYQDHIETGFAFASEAKALPNRVVKADYQQDKFYSNLQHTLGSLYEGVEQLEPAHYAVYNFADKTLKKRRYWRFSPREVNEKSALEEFEYLLENSVSLRTRADVPYGIYFSGGVDSSLIRSCHPFERVFTYDYDENNKEDFEANLQKILYHLDFPVGSFTPYALWSLARKASREVKVVLSGEGADEIFGGYMRYQPIAIQHQLRSRYPSYKELFNKTFSEIYAKQFAKTTARGEDLDFVYELMKPYFAEHDPITAMQLFDFENVMPSLLQMSDRMTSAFGIENRLPFLDRRLIEFGLSLPPHLKIWNFEGKVLPRQLVTQRGLKIEAEKRGLIAPYNQWYNLPGYDRTEYFKHMNKVWYAMVGGKK